MKNIPSLLTLASGIIIAYSVLYDWAYYSAVGSELFMAMTLADHVSSSLQRLPLLSVSILIALAFSLIGSHKNPQSVVPNNALVIYESPTSGTFYKIPDSKLSIIILAIFVVLTIFLLPSPLWFLLFFLFLGIWDHMAKWLLNAMRHFNLNSYTPLGYYIPLFMAYSLVLGFSSGQYILQKHIGRSSVYLENETPMIFVSVLAVGEDTVIVRNHYKNTNYIVPKGNILRIEQPFTIPSHNSIACDWFKFCFFDNAETK